MGSFHSKTHKRNHKKNHKNYGWEVVDDQDKEDDSSNPITCQNKTDLMATKGNVFGKINENYQKTCEFDKTMSSGNLSITQYTPNYNNPMNSEIQCSPPSFYDHSSQQDLVNFLSSYSSVNSSDDVNDNEQIYEKDEQSNNEMFQNSTSLDYSQITADKLHIGHQIFCTLPVIPKCSSLCEELSDFIRRKSCILQQKYKTSNPKYFNICLEEKSQCNDILFSKEEPITPDDFAKKLKWNTEVGRRIKILISGSPRFGKSIFCLYLAYYWAMAKSEFLNGFQLVFLIEGKLYNTLKHCLLNQILETDEKDDEISRKKYYEFLKKIQDKILIIIDDFDQINNCEEVKKIITCKLFPESTVIITSRPNKTKEISPLFVKHLNITGFCSKQIHSYAESFFTKSTFIDLSKIVGDIKKIEILFSCPFLSYLLCDVAENEKEFQINPTLTKYLTRVFTKAIYELDEIPLKLGKFCYEKIVHNNLRYTAKENAVLTDFEWFHDNVDNSKSYLFNFFIAVYLIENIEKENFRELLWTYLGKHNNFDILRFLVCLAQEKVKTILENLPWSYTQDILLLLNLMNENFNIEYVSSIIQYFPNWIKFIINEGCIIIEQPIRNINIVSDYSLMLSTNNLLLDSVLKFKFLNIIKLPDYQLSQFYFEINQIDPDTLVYALKILQTLEMNPFLLCLIIDVHKITEQFIELLNKLKHPSLKSLIFVAEDVSENSSEIIKKLDCSTLNERLPQLSLLQIKSKHVFPHIIMQLFKCDHLDSLTIQPLSIEYVSSLSTLIIEKKIFNLSVQLINNKENIKLFKSLPLKHQHGSSLLLPLCSAINNSENVLTSLDLRFSELIYADVHCLLKHIVKSNCTTLLLGGCINKMKNGPLEVDLGSVAPPQKVWTYLDFSNWKLILSRKETGQIKKLKIYDIDKPVNILEITQLFKIQSLCCNYCKLLEQNNLCSELRELKLYLPDEETFISLSKVFKNFPNMNVLKFKSKSNFYTHLKHDQNLWKNSALACHNIGFTITFCPEKTIEDMLQMMMKIIIEKRNIQKFTLNMSFFCKKIWERYMDEILMFLEGVFCKRYLQEVKVIQKSESYSYFVQQLSAWQMKNCKTFSLSSSINSKNKISVIISHPKNEN